MGRKSDPAQGRVLDENFECLMRVANCIGEDLARPKDREICFQTLEDLSKFNRSSSSVTKRHVRKFLAFYLQVLRWTQVHQPLGLYEKWYNTQCKSDKGNQQSDEMHVWLEHGVSYLAMKHFEDGSTIVYSAVSRNPNNGWAEGGLKTLVSGGNTAETSTTEVK
ncbi:uncharacterized protein LOC6575631 [Drosophila mojavensis]|uniref:DUF4485 domain-containing protein n=1 Tax=Drosophila mojavensis TaxID=7230 RepID=B4KG95_DROMO|nr:uncharacterized protein LOC6575631 [Drosophila mojavensis]EDW11082.1 uncharacterized protein Dmoj_GI16840 [Drosophila mojavensis]